MSALLADELPAVLDPLAVDAVDPAAFDPAARPLLDHAALGAAIFDAEPEVDEGLERAAPEQSGVGEIRSPATDRDRLEAQLRELQRKEAELRRAIAISDHPELADAIREVEGRAFRVARVEQRLAAPLSKGELKRRDQLAGRLDKARARRAELDEEIAKLELEIEPLGEARLVALRGEREAALLALLVVMNRHADAFTDAKLAEVDLVPELARWLPDLRAMAEAQIG